MQADIEDRGVCPKCGKILTGTSPDVAWGYWFQIVGDRHGGEFDQMLEISANGSAGDEALRVTCQFCGFQFLEPILESGRP